MAATLITPGTSLTTANSYATIEEAGVYFEPTAFSVAWEALSTPDKTNVLIEATRLIDTTFRFLGTAAYSTQSLAFPRNHGVSGILVDAAGVPNLVKEAQFHLVWFINRQLGSDGTAPDRAFTEFRLEGVMSIKFPDTKRPARMDQVSGGTLERVQAILAPLVGAGASPSSLSVTKW